ncbi:MAG: hypothetical protein KBC96_12075 [Armatimonadetes bacterium]|nr:hypothetical protein [Armatimonadota bacterium]
MFDTRYLADDSTASVSAEFGQATLRTTGESDWLTATDLAGNTWIPASTKIRYACNTDGSAPTAYLESADAEACLDGDRGTMWVEETGSSTDVFLEIQVPTDVMTNMLANTLVLRPFPVLCHDLVSVDVISTSGNVYSLSGARLAYLPGYSTGDEIVHCIGDIRLFFPPTAVASLRIHLQAGAFPYWGFSEVSLKTTTFASTSSLSLDLAAVAGTSSLSAAELCGDDSEYLSAFPATIVGNTVKWGLTQRGAGYTPVITSVRTEWL